MTKKIFCFFLCVLMVIPAIPATKFEHPWQGKRVAYLGDSITDPKNNGAKKHYWAYLQEMLGITNKEYTLSKRAGRIHELRTYMSMLRHFVRLPRDMEKLNETFAEVTVSIEKTMPEAAGIASLKEIYNGLSERILKKWGITLLNDMYAFIFAGALKAYLKHLKVSDAETIANAHISGILNIESMKPVRSLDKLMYLARDTGCVDALRRCTDNAETEAVLGTLDPAFSGAFHAYIREYGDRAPEELKLESRTFRTDPHLLGRAISDRGDAVKPAPAGPE